MMSCWVGLKKECPWRGIIDKWTRLAFVNVVMRKGGDGEGLLMLLLSSLLSLSSSLLAGGDGRLIA
jgi:hypothetical protein